MKTQAIKDWEPETKSLLKALIAAGFALESGDNGEDQFKYDGNLAGFIENLIACDEAWIYVKNSTGKELWIYLVLGNEPGVIASDYVCDVGLDKVTDAHYTKWESRRQPTKEQTI